MAIETLRVHERHKPESSADVALIYIANPDDSKPPVEYVIGLDGFHSVTTIRAGDDSDIAAVMHDRISSLEFSTPGDLVVALFSDCQAVSALDAAYIAHIDMPNVPMETPNGDRIVRFKVQVRAVVENEFENGVVAALDGVVVDANPHPCGTPSHDKWLAGHQSSQAEVIRA